MSTAEQGPDKALRHPVWGWEKKAGHQPDGWKGLLPELHIMIGRDAASSGMTVWIWTPGNGAQPVAKVLWWVRWGSPVMSAQEALEVAYRGIAELLAAQYGVSPPE